MATDSVVDQSVLMKFAQKLASNEKKYRDRAVKRVKKWLAMKSSSCEGGLNADDMLKIWKGLHYCMWMSDKPLIQEELADQIASLIHAFNSVDQSLLFISAFFDTEAREWYGIDGLRLDKFLMLIRRFFNQTLQLLSTTRWHPKHVNALLAMLRRGVVSGVNESVPDGLKFHFADIYLDELRKVGVDQLDEAQVLTFLKPYCLLLAKTTNKNLSSYVKQRVFQPFVKGAKEAAAAEDEGDEEDETPDQPQRLSVDYKELADVLFKLGSGPKCHARNRSQVYHLVTTFRNLAAGILPEEERASDLPNEEVTDKEVNLALERMQSFEAKLGKTTSKKLKQEKQRRKRKRKGAAEHHGNDDDGDGGGEDVDEGRVSTKRRRQNLEEELNSSGSDKENKKARKAKTRAKKKGKASEQMASGLPEEDSQTAPSQTGGKTKTKNKYVDTEKAKQISRETDRPPVDNSSRFSSKAKTKKKRADAPDNETGDHGDLRSLFVGGFESDGDDDEGGDCIPSLQEGPSSADEVPRPKLKTKKKSIKRLATASETKKKRPGTELNIFAGGFVDEDDDDIDSGTAVTPSHDETQEITKGAKTDKKKQKMTKKKNKKKKEEEEQQLGAMETSSSDVSQVVASTGSDVDMALETGNSETVMAPALSNESPSEVSMVKKKKKKKNKKTSQQKTEPEEWPVCILVEDQHVGTSTAVAGKAHTEGNESHGRRMSLGNLASTAATGSESSPVQQGPKKKKRKSTGDIDTGAVAGVGEPMASGAVKKAEQDASHSAHEPFARFETAKRSPAAFVKRAMAKVAGKSTVTPKSVARFQVQDVSSPDSARKQVMFNMSLNKAQDYGESLQVSPMVPFDPGYRPEMGILKASPVVSATSSSSKKRRAAITAQAASPSSPVQDLFPKQRAKAADFF